VLKYIEEKHGHVQSFAWFGRFLDRHSSEIIRNTAAAQENPRLEVPRAWLDQYLGLITKMVPVACCELIYSVDETGLSDWEERRSKQVIAPAATKGQTLHYRADRGIRHQTLVCTISAGGDAYSPLLLTSDQTTLRLFDKPIRRGIDFSVQIKDSPYVDTETFRNYIIQTIIPHFAADRNGALPESSPAILFFDNCRPHCADDILEALARAWVMVISYPPHTPGVFQVLDKLIFGVLKTVKRHVAKTDTLPPAADHARRIFLAYERATVSETVRSAWVYSGFDCVKREGMWYLTVNEERIRESPEFKEVRDIDFPEQRLSQKRRSQKWGWINQSWFPKKFRDYVFGKGNEGESSTQSLSE
jgi:hypothetical protein